MISYSRAKGVYGGLNLDRTVVSTNDDWNKACYGKAVTPVDILIRQTVRNRQAATLVKQTRRHPGIAAACGPIDRLRRASGTQFQEPRKDLEIADVDDLADIALSVNLSNKIGTDSQLQLSCNSKTS